MVPPRGWRWPGVLTDRGASPVVVAAALAQVATLAVTWPLWSNRTDPVTLPLVPALDLPGYGLLLGLTALAVVAWPRRAGPLHCVVLAAACAGDQTRVQPEVVSLAVLMTAPAFGAAGRQIARWHLAGLWLWSGLHKALSYGWSSAQAVVVAQDLGRPGLRAAVATVVPAAEVSVGLAALVPRLRPFARWGGALVHVGIVLWLSPLAAGRNVAVWPWNVALVVAALDLFGPDRQPWDTGPRAVRALAVAVLVAGPALYYWRGDQAYLSHHLYSSSVPEASACGPGGCDRGFFDTGTRVPFPPEPRLFRQRFDRTCPPGWTLVVRVPDTRLRAGRTETHSCPSTSPPTRPPTPAPSAP